MRVARQRKLDQKRGWAFATVVAIVKPTLNALTKHEWHDGLKIPASGGCVIAVNHLSKVDPMTFGLFAYEHGRMVRYLAKQEIFETPVLKTIAVNAGQIPVARLSTDAADAFDAAVQAVHEGQAVAFYPEGTITRDPDLWPMRGKTGAARVALSTGCPVIPVGQWGAQELLPPYGRPNLFPRKTMKLKAGDPVDLSDLQGRPLTNEVLHEATNRIMAAITLLVADLRGETAPERRFDPKAAGVRQTGNPNEDAKQARRRKRGSR